MTVSSGVRPYLGSLTSLRLLAVVHVVLFHAEGAGYLSDAPGWVLRVVSGAHSAIGLLFIMSGFILTYSYVPEAEPRTDWRAFWVARFARIYPFYLLSLIVAAPLFFDLAQGTEKKLALVMVPTLTQSWVPGLTGLWNGGTWAVSVLVFFYVVFPFLAPRLARWPTSRLLLAGLACWMFGLLVPVAYTFAVPAGAWPADLADGTVRYITRNPLLRLPEFIFGIVLGSLFLRYQGRGWTRAAPLVAMLSAGVLLMAYLLTPSLPIVVVTNGLFAPIEASLIISLAAGGPGLAWMLSRPVLVFLSEGGYVVYLFHQPVLLWLARVTERFAATRPYIEAQWFLAVYLMLLLGLSVFTYVLFQMPASRATRHLLLRRSVRPAGSARTALHVEEVVS